ncbi:MAG: hypothetical protein OXU81_22185 [Gammaproteobacteria bacterium]|nr:hypothetical protein [Gammaproteobacteria bacterium]
MSDPNAPPLDSESLVGLLDRHGVAYVLVGGLAAVAHGATRATFDIDIDIVPRWETDNLDALAGALRAANARLRVPGAERPVEVPLDGSTLSHYEVSTWRTDYGDIDVVVGTPTRVRGQLASFDDLAANAKARSAFGVVILIADLNDIIESKEALDREPDRTALPELRQLRDRNSLP